MKRVMICEECGMLFVAKSSNAKYCGEQCAGRVKRRRMKAQERREYDANGGNMMGRRGGCECCPANARCCDNLRNDLPTMCEEVWPVDLRIAQERGILERLFELRPEARAMMERELCGLSLS